MKSLDVFMQWIHISSVVVAVGGMFLLRFVACPAIKQVFPDDESARKRLAEAMVRRFKIVVHASITFLLASGGYLLWRAWPLARESAAFRHGIELKVLLALVLFFLSIMLTVTRPEPNFFQRKKDCWLTVNFLLALVIIGLAVFIRSTHS
jgi:uncharacterized membrane protein